MLVLPRVPAKVSSPSACRPPLSAVVGDAPPRQIRGTAFAIYDVAVGIATLAAGIGAGALWLAGGPAASLAIVAALVLLLRPVPRPAV